MQNDINLVKYIKMRNTYFYTLVVSIMKLICSELDFNMQIPKIRANA